MLVVARERTQTAAARAAAAREASAVAYDPASTVYDQLAASGQGDVADTGGSRMASVAPLRPTVVS